MVAAPEDVTIAYGSRAIEKLHRAGTLFRGLEMAIDRWNDERQVLAPARLPSSGPPGLEVFRPTVLDAIPWSDWEATFHDGVHNLRAGLDNLCFEMCHFEGRSPAEPGRIHFPITSDPAEWPRRTRHLGSVPKALLQRLRECQPWARASQEPDPLALIARIDNVDKHRASGVEFDVIPWPQWHRPAGPLPEELDPRLNWAEYGWLRFEFGEEIAGRGVREMIPVFALPVVRFEGLAAVVPDAQRWLWSETKRVIDYIARGRWPDPGFERVFPEPTWWTTPAVPDPPSDQPTAAR